jgi:hypothetical protein
MCEHGKNSKQLMELAAQTTNDLEDVVEEFV